MPDSSGCGLVQKESPSEGGAVDFVLDGVQDERAVGAERDGVGVLATAHEHSHGLYSHTSTSPKLTSRRRGLHLSSDTCEAAGRMLRGLPSPWARPAVLSSGLSWGRARIELPEE
eukprot:3102092-Pyramimonas_sp.AAC.1